VYTSWPEFQLSVLTLVGLELVAVIIMATTAVAQGSPGYFLLQLVEAFVCILVLYTVWKAEVTRETPSSWPLMVYLLYNFLDILYKQLVGFNSPIPLPYARHLIDGLSPETVNAINKRIAKSRI